MIENIRDVGPEIRPEKAGRVRRSPAAALGVAAVAAMALLLAGCEAPEQDPVEIIKSGRFNVTGDETGENVCGEHPITDLMNSYVEGLEWSQTPGQAGIVNVDARGAIPFGEGSGQAVLHFEVNVAQGTYSVSGLTVDGDAQDSEGLVQFFTGVCRTLD